MTRCVEHEIIIVSGMRASSVGIVSTCRKQGTISKFDRKVEETSQRVNRGVAELTERLEKETAELIQYLNEEVVPAARLHSSNALRIASEKLAEFAHYLDETKSSR